MYTLKDLEEARAELQNLSSRWANYDGNNPNKYQGEIRAARQKVASIQEFLSATELNAGLRAPTIDETLTRLYPNAPNRLEVLYEGKRYRKRYAPAERSRSRKTVVSWSSWWEEVVTGE
jgi:hypothetical protein